MSDQEIMDKIKTIVVDILGVEEDSIKPEASFIDDLGADSIDTVELVMALEQNFDLEIPDGEAEKIKTVGDAIDYIKENK
jgi:acyl carrier protein